MAITKGLQLLVVVVGISSCFATPLNKLSKGKSAGRLVELTTPRSMVIAKRGYAEAGYRPRIPFELPKRPETVTEGKLEKVSTTTTTTTTSTTTSAPSISTTTTTTESTLEDFDEIVPTTTTVIPFTPASTYGPPTIVDEAQSRNHNRVATESDQEIDAEVIPAPAEDFQPPSEEGSLDFDTTFGIVNTVDGVIIADIPGTEQTTETESVAKQTPAIIYGAPESENPSKTEKETVETIDAEAAAETTKEIQVETQEGSADSGFNILNEPRIPEPADVYGVPTAYASEAKKQLEAELASIEEQIEILNRLTQLKNGRLVFLPVDDSIYLGRVISTKATKKDNLQNGRLLKL